MKKISIIIPCYNAEKTIGRCAASLLGQTIGREGLELIFVNDGSTDGTCQKLLEIEAENPDDVMIINLEENMGQGAARNAGMSYASGKYLGFADADDYVEPDMYETLYAKAEEYGCDMAGGGYIRDVMRQKPERNGQEMAQEETASEEKGIQTEIPDVLPTEQRIQADLPENRRQLILAGTSVTFAGRIYRTELIRERELYFLEHMLYEDNYWQSMVNLEVRSYYICRKCFYHYVETEGSSTKTITDRNFLQSMQTQVFLMQAYAQKGLLELFPQELNAKFLKSHTVMNLLGMYLEWQEIPEQIYEQMYTDVHTYAEVSAENPYLWKADQGLLKDMFEEQLTAEERNNCMKQYTEYLQQGKIDRWKSLFEERRKKRKEEEKKAWELFCDSCFELGRYSKEKQENGTFTQEAEALLKVAEQLGRFQEGTAYLEQMISHQGDYKTRLIAVSPILVYKGDPICYNVLNDFAEQMIDSLRRAGKQVEEYDVSKSGAEGLVALCGRTFQAVIGFQTYLFGVKLKSGENLHDTIHGPKLHFIFDHPLWMKEHLEQGPKDYYILTHGRDYQEFVKRYFRKEVKKCFLLPPAGCFAEPETNGMREKLDLTFIGTWYDYRERLEFIRNTRTNERYLANRFLLIMKKNPNLRAEEAFLQALADYGIQLEDDAFKSVLFDMKQVCFCIMTYYREKIIKYILDAGIQIHVYGESWKKSPLSKYENLICHPEVSVQESLKILQNSKLSLNIMSWHKGGFTERIANTLLSGAVAVSDKSWYLEENFQNGKEMLLFDLKEPEKLVENLKYLLCHEEKRKKIAAAGRKKALREHTWDVRAAQLLDYMDELREGENG